MGVASGRWENVAIDKYLPIRTTANGKKSALENKYQETFLGTTKTNTPWSRRQISRLTFCECSRSKIPNTVGI